MSSLVLGSRPPVNLVEAATEATFWGALGTTLPLIAHALTAEGAKMSALNIPPVQTEIALSTGLHIAAVAAICSMVSQAYQTASKA